MKVLEDFRILVSKPRHLPILMRGDSSNAFELMVDLKRNCVVDWHVGARLCV